MIVCRLAAAQPSGPAEESAAPYRVDCTETPAVCRVDVATYIGWRVFQKECATCHAADAQGSSFAPDLTLRMQGMGQREFFAALDHGYFGPLSTEPPRGRSPNVAPYYRELWSYLSARRSGELRAGRLQPIGGSDTLGTER